jgi:hypothetical protein
MELEPIKKREVDNGLLSRLQWTGVVVADMFLRDARRTAQNMTVAASWGQGLLELFTGNSQEHAERLKKASDGQQAKVESRIHDLENKLQSTDAVIDLVALENEAKQPDWRRLAELSVAYLRGNHDLSSEEERVRARRIGRAIQEMPVPIGELGLPTNDIILLHTHAAHIAHERAMAMS